MRYRVPDAVAWIDAAEFRDEDDLYLATLPGGTTVLLQGPARLIWLVAAAGGGAEPAASILPVGESGGNDELPARFGAVAGRGAGAAGGGGGSGAGGPGRARDRRGHRDLPPGPRRAGAPRATGRVTTPR